MLAVLDIWQQCQAGRFLPQGDGTVYDCWTDLYLLADANCFGPLLYADATLATEELGDTGSPDPNDDCGLSDGSAKGDWRLPTHLEWRRIVEFAEGTACPQTLTDDSGRRCWSDATGTTSITGLLATGYWSSTEVATDVYQVSLFDGSVGLVAQNGAALLTWPVRSGF